MESTDSKARQGFELTVDVLLLYIEKVLEAGKDDKITFKFIRKTYKPDKRETTNITKGDETSRIDALAHQFDKKICIDAKSAVPFVRKDKSIGGTLPNGEVLKLLRDTRMNQALPGILVMQEDGELVPCAEKTCNKLGITIVKLTTKGTPIRKYENYLKIFCDKNIIPEFLTQENAKRLRTVIRGIFSAAGKLDGFVKNITQKNYQLSRWEAAKILGNLLISNKQEGQKPVINLWDASRAVEVKGKKTEVKGGKKKVQGSS